MWQPGNPYDKLSLKGKFPAHGLSFEERAQYQNQHINPLLMPEIKKAHDAVQAAMFGSPHHVLG